MTDREILKALFDKRGIPYEEPESVYPGNIDHGEVERPILLAAHGDWTKPRKVCGYSGYRTLFEFDDTDTLARVSIWEW